MVDAGSIWVRLGLNTDDLEKGIQKSKASMLEWRGETINGAADTLKWGAALTATAAPILAMGYALVDVTNKAAAFGKSLKDNARDLGLSTEQYQRWTHAAIASGSSAEEMSGSIRMLTIRLKEASDPASETSRYLKALGVSAYDSNGKLRDTDSVLKDLLPALNALPEGMERNQASMVLFGRSFSNIADLTSLTRTELQSLMDQAPVFDDDKIQKMDDYATSTALLNEQIQYLTVDIGTEFIPVMEDMLSLLDDMEPAISAIGWAFHATATGMHQDIQGLQLLYTQWRYGMDSPEMKALQADVQADYEKEMRWRSGYTDMSSYGARDAKRRYGGSSSIVLPSPVEKAAATSAASGSSRSSVGSGASWAASSVVGSAGSEMQLFLQREMELGNTYEDALSRWTRGEPTNETPASGTLGALSASKKPASQEKALQELTKVTETEYQKQTDAFQKHLDALATLRAERYPALETLDLTHWATGEEIAKTAIQKELDFMAAAVNFGGTNPIVQNYIVMSRNGPDWTPPAFQAVTAPKLESADFTQVGAAVQGIVAKGLGGGTSGSGGSQNIKVDVVVKDQTSGGIRANVQAVNERLAGADYGGGRK